MVFPKKNSDWDYPERGRGAPSPTRSMADIGEGANGRRASAQRIDPLSGDMRRDDPAALSEKVVFRLWADGLVNARSIEQARREVDGRLRLDQALARLNLVDGEAVASALAAELGMPLVDDADFPREPVAADMLPGRFVAEALALPLSDDGRNMRLALADPIDDFALRAIAMKTKRRLEICVASPDQLEAAIARLYKGVERAQPAPSPRRESASGGVLALTGAQRAADMDDDEDEPLSGAALREEPMRRDEPMRQESARQEFSRQENARRLSESPRDASLVEHIRRAPLRESATAFAPAPQRDDEQARSPLELNEIDTGGKLTPRFVRPRRVTVKDRLSKPPIRPGLEGALNGQPRERRDDAKRRLDRLRDEVSARMSEPPSPAPMRRERPESPSKRRFVTGFVTGFMGEPGAPAPRMAAPRRHNRAAAPAPDGFEPGFSDHPTSIDAAVEALGKSLHDPLDDPFAPAARPVPEAPAARASAPEAKSSAQDGRSAAAHAPEVDSAEIERRALLSARGRSRNSVARRLVMSEVRRALRGEAPPEPEEAKRPIPSADGPSGGQDIYQAARAVVERQATAGSDVGSLVRHTLICEPAPTTQRRRETPAADTTAGMAAGMAAPAASASIQPQLGAVNGASADDADIEVDLAEMAFNAKARDALEQAVAGGEGLILVCGPSGSGKADTSKALAAMAARNGAELKRFDRGSDVRAPRAADAPPVAFTGEIRDAEGAEAAARAAMTGNLVIATLDAPSAAAAAPRLYGMGLPPYVLASSLRAVVAQHLAPRICQRCASNGGGKRGCPDCGGQGRSGSVAIVEWMVLDDTIRALILAQAPAAAFRHAMSATHTPSLADDAAEKVSAGLVREADAARAASAIN